VSTGELLETPPDDTSTASDEEGTPAPSPSRKRTSRRHLLLAPALAMATTACTREEVERFFAAIGKPLPGTNPPTPPAPAPPPATSPPPTTPPPPPEPTDVTAALAVDKLTFGPKPGLVEAVQAMGVQAWIDRQLAPAGLPDAEGLLASPDFATLRNTNLANLGVLQDKGEDRLCDELDHATLLRAVRSERQLYEVMCDFWANHFNIWRHHSYIGFMRIRDNEDVIRPNALGKFRDMLLASAHSPAMLDYLDNLPSDASTPGGVNQNYARELMELHTLGIINGEHVYTEDDVQAVAMVLSGWSIRWEEDDPQRFTFEFHPYQHTDQAVSAFGGAFTAPAHPDHEGYDDGVRLLTFLANHPSTARYIAYKLCRRFIADNPPMNVVESAAAVFTANDTAIAPTLRHIFRTPEFAASGRRKVRRPLEHLTACCRALGASVPTNPQGNAAYAMRRALEDMGQPIFERVSPDGYPDVAPYWVSSEGLLKRWGVSGKIARNKLTWYKESDKLTVDLVALLPNPLPATVGDLVVWMAQNLGNFTMPPADVADLCTSIAVPSSGAAATLSGNASKLALAAGLVLSHPTFQRR